MTGIVRSRPFLLSLAALSLALAGVLPLVGSRPGVAGAHPLGNFTINRYSRIELYSDAVRLRYVLDMAEIPTFQEMDRIDANGDGQREDAETAAYAQAKANELASNLRLAVGGRAAALRVLSRELSFPEGQAGLNTLRLSVLLDAPLNATGPRQLDYSDDNYSDRIGWKEIVVRPADRVQLGGPAPTEDVSHELTGYPGDLLTSPLDIRQVSVSFDATAGTHAPVVGAAAQPATVTKAPERSGAGFAALINTDDLSLAIIALALLAAFGFGALHALEPGHGKTFVAAYFVGVKGTPREAVTLGAIIATTHTIGVLAIGMVTLFGSQWILPERLYPWLTLASALMVLGLGVRLMLWRGGLGCLKRVVLRTSHRPRAHGHPHEHGHAHLHAAPVPGTAPWRSLVALGLADGLTPSPSALVVIVAAVSLHRLGLGLALVISFSLGLAGVLTAVCLGLVFARRIIAWFERRAAPLKSFPYVRTLSARFNGEAIVARTIPLAGAGVLVVVGLLLTVRALGNHGFGI